MGMIKKIDQVDQSIPDTPTSIIEKVDHLLQKAIALCASDIHLEPTCNALRVRFRIDGILHDQMPIEQEQMLQVLSRIKILAHLNIAEKRIPQDGKLPLFITHENIKKPIDLRISTFPSIYGEKIVIRILDRNTQQKTLKELGFPPHDLEKFRQLISKSSGFLLVTGPTGSGKTTTLYCALNELNHPQTNIMTLEDPVEYHIDGIVQGHIHPDSGFTFAKAIRSLLRQDPDIALIGEIRDKESARIAIEAALTGHLVLSTLHTTDAPSALIRLLDMTIEPFLINAAISGILAQRLARTICAECKESYTPNKLEQEYLHKYNSSTDKLFKGRGCKACLDIGMKGRTGIFELLSMSSILRSSLAQTSDLESLKSLACKEGMKTLSCAGIEKVINGEISFEEFIRVCT